MRIPIDIHEAGVTKYLARAPRTGEPIPDTEIDTLASSCKAAREAAEALKAAHDVGLRDTTRTANARLLDLRGQAIKVAEVQARRLDAARQRATAEIERIEKAIHGPQPVEPTIASEIRTMLKTMKAEERRELIMDAIRAGDDATVSAVLGAPGYLSGHGDAVLAGFRDAWQRQRFPAEHDRVNRLRKALDAQGRAARSFMGMVRDLSAGTAEHLAGVAEEAAAANAAINRHMTGEAA